MWKALLPSSGHRGLKSADCQEEAAQPVRSDSSMAWMMQWRAVSWETPS